MRTISARCLIVLTTLLATQGSFAKTRSADLPDMMSVAYEKSVALAKRLEEREGIPAQETLKALQSAKYQPKVVDAVRPPKSPTVKNWTVYRDRFVEPIRIRKGLKFWGENEALLNQATQAYGVPAEVIVAIIGVETIYGEHTGNFRVIDSLSTLGFAYPQGQKDRSDFFQRELEAFFVLCRKAGLDPLEVKGSYAGAVGLGQFMPSSWLNFAVDGDQDQHIDLFHSRADAILSVGNFLKVHGWQAGKTGIVAVDFTRTDALPEVLASDILPKFTNQALTERGIVAQGPVLTDELLALVELVRGEDSPVYVLGGQNFYAVTRYNRSAFYATAVLELAAALRRSRP